MSKIVDFTLGADPELTCMESRKMVNSGDFVDEFDEFGSDGNGVTFEIRPKPDKDPLKVVSNIHDIFVRRSLSDPKYMKYKWVSGSYYNGYAMGGHIHFGTRGKVQNDTAVEVLNQYLAPVSFLIDQVNHGKARRRKGYGELGDYREQNHGFEYRTPGSWLTSPYVAAAMLALSKTLIYELLNNKSFQFGSGYITSANMKYSDIDAVKQKFPLIWKDITQMKLYQVYKPYLDVIYYLVNNNLTWFPNVSMKEAWGLLDVSKFQKNKVDIGIIWNRFNSQMENAQ